MKTVPKGLFLYEVEAYSGLLIDLYETSEELVFEVDLPGIDPSHISVRAYEDLLIIEGVRNDLNKTTALKYLCLERGARLFRRVLKIPVPVNTMSGNAVYANGVMTIKFPKFKDRMIKIAVERRGN